MPHTPLPHHTQQRLQLFPLSAQLVEGNLHLGGCDLQALAAQCGTPLYIYDHTTLEDAVTGYKRALAAHYPHESHITYAGKAYLSTAIAQWALGHELMLDCTGLGEIAVAVKAGAPRAQVLVHGVNKSRADLLAAIEYAGVVVVDNLSELNRLIELSTTYTLPHLWLRLQPGEAVETHSYTQTGHEDSKFGMSPEQLVQAAALFRQHGLPLAGIHFHQGSQFRDPMPLADAIDKALELVKELGLGDLPEWHLCPGGGWGVAYHEDELPHPNVEDYIQFVCTHVVEKCRAHGLKLPVLHVEPGRSLVARAGVALYRVGTVKETAHRLWVLVDGGMADNPRHALYGARYSALPVKATGRMHEKEIWVAGPYCESGDVLIEALPFPLITEGELSAVPVAGAYHLSMSSNYNGARRPAVLMLENGQARLMQARETPEDLLRRDA